jgi:tetratricopeptide (TPR) repeat protein
MIAPAERRFRAALWSLAALVIAPFAWMARSESALYASAEVMYRATIARHPDSWLALTNLAVIELDRDPSGAVARLQQSLRLNAGFAETHFALGRGLQALGRNEEAVGAYRTAIRLRPAHAQTYDNLGTVLAGLGRPAEAEPELRRAIALKPDLAGAHSNLGIVLGMLGRVDEAIASHREAISLAPELGFAHANLGNALFQAGRYGEAAAAYRDAARRIPEHPLLGGLIEKADAAARQGRGR